MSIRSALADERSGRVVFVSHCLLNENTRYPGGAFRPGAVTEVVEPFLRDGTGLCQMPCPEQIAWGGVGKRHMVRFWGRPRTARLARFGLPAFLGYTRLRYRRLARRVAESIADYQANGVSVVAVVGVGASPSCGVATTVDVAAALDSVAGCPFARLDRQVVNDAIAGATRSGPGIFMDELGRALGRRGLSVPLREHDLRSERPGSHLSPGAHPVTLDVDRVVTRAPPPWQRRLAGAVGLRFDPAQTDALMGATKAAIAGLERRVPPGLNRGGRHLLEQGVFVITFHQALCEHGLPEGDATDDIADYFRGLGLGALCEQTICVQDERAARTYREAVGIRFERKGTIAGGAERCDFRYRPTTIGPLEG